MSDSDVIVEVILLSAAVEVISRTQSILDSSFESSFVAVVLRGVKYANPTKILYSPP